MTDQTRISENKFRHHLGGVRFGGSLLAVLLLSACSSAPQPADLPETTILEEPAEQSASPDDEEVSDETYAGHATALIAGREFTFQLDLCVMYNEEEVELRGLGGEIDSDVPSFLDGGAMRMDSDPLGEFRIDLGADGPFQSSDEFLSLGAPTGGDITFTVVKEGNEFVATGKTWGNTGVDHGTGTLRFVCN
ncbi:hypothetical protein [Microbacterium sp. A93]|uniref:hypothetical protein n=1 Tax=Microbacterium sp. A93 TaxID=3450716 RepID=UPI003F4384A5